MCPLELATAEERKALTASGASPQSQLRPVVCICPDKDVCGANCSISGDACEQISKGCILEGVVLRKRYSAKSFLSLLINLYNNLNIGSNPNP